MLTIGADTIVGTAGNDVINALTVGADGKAATTLSGFDSIDGGAGNDTLNIYSNGTGNENASLPASATIKNVETINIINQGTTPFNAAGIDASKFVGATSINQSGLEADVTKLAAGVTAGYKTIGPAATLSVTAADAAASAALSFDGVSDEITSVTVGGAALNTVTLSGSLTDTSEDKINTIALNVNAGATQTGLTLNTAFNSNVTLTGAALATVNAAGSTGGVNVGAGGRAEVQTVAIPALNIGDTFDLVAGTVTLSSSLAAASADELLADLQADADYATAPFTVALNAGKTALVLAWKNTGDVTSLATLTKDPTGSPLPPKPSRVPLVSALSTPSPPAPVTTLSPTLSLRPLPKALP